MHTLRHNKILSIAFAASVAFILLVLPFVVFANEPNALFSAGDWIGYQILSLAAWFTGAGGKLLDLALAELVLGMGSALDPSAQGGGIGVIITEIWRVIRDFCNLAFIFGFVSIGIRTIFNYESSETRKTLVAIIIGALLINFSLFFTKVVIDASNMLAAEIYNAALTGDTIPGNEVEKSIGLAFANQLGIGTIYQSPGGKHLQDLTSGGVFWFYIAGSIFLLIAGFVLAAGAFLLVTRFVALVLIMIFSPILFAATIFSKTGGTAKKLWSQLFNQAFFAPVYLLLIYISLSVVAVTGQKFGVASGNTFADTFKGSEEIDSYGVILNFVIVTAFMIMALTVAQKFGVYGGNKAVSIGNGMRKSIQSMIGRNTIGPLANKFGKILDKTEEKLGRPIPLVSQNLRSVADSGKNATFGGSKSYKSTKDYGTQRKKEISRARAVSDISGSIANGSGAAPGSAEYTQMEHAVAGASSAQFLEMAKSGAGRKSLLRAAGLMSQSNFDSIMKSDDLDDNFKREFKSARQGSVKQELNYEQQPRKVGSASKEQLRSIDFDTLKENALYLQNDQLKNLEGILTSGQLTALETTRKSALESAANSVDDAARVLKTRKSEKEIATLPKAFIEHENFVSAAFATGLMSTSLLTKIALDSDANKVKLGTAIQEYLEAHGHPRKEGFENWFNSGIGLQFK